MVAITLVILCGILLSLTSPASAKWNQDRIMVHAWINPPMTDEWLAVLAADHYTVMTAQEPYLDIFHKHGLKVLLQNDLIVPDALDNPDKRAKLDALIERVKSHPGLEGYYITDEPGAGAFPAYARLKSYINKRDPNHLAYLNLLPTYASETQLGVDTTKVSKDEIGIPTDFAGVSTSDRTVVAYQKHLRDYVNIYQPELISYDHYHFLKNGDGAQYFLNLGLIRKAAIDARVPFLNIVQTCTVEKTWRLVTEPDIRWLVYTTLAYGGRGLGYFIFWGDRTSGGMYVEEMRMPLADYVATLNGEIASLSPILMKLDSIGTYHTNPLPYGTQAIPADSPVKVVSTGDFVLGLFGKSGKASSFMLVNRSYKTRASARLTVPADTRRLLEYDRTQKRWVNYAKPGKDGVVTINLEPGDGRLFRL